MQSNNKKTKTQLGLDSFEIVACKDKELRSFLNVFHFKEENLSKSQLGELFGVIQVFDHSEQSAYLPNLVSQVIKKEFFQNTKLSTEESFEHALKKANIALSDLARHEVVDWIDKFNAVIGVIQEENFFFTQAKGGKILLIREGKINDISRDLDNNESTHPIKTFLNVSSGKLQSGDKLLFVTESFFDLFSWEDTKRHVKTFNSNELDNLIRSTTESEGENIGITVVNITEKDIVPIASLPKTKKRSTKNFFGSQNKEKDKEEKGKDANENSVPDDPDKESEGNKTGKEKKLSPFEREPELYIKEGGVDDEKIDMPKHRKNILEKLRDTIEKKKFVSAIPKEEKEEKKPEVSSNEEKPKTKESNKKEVKKGSILLVKSPDAKDKKLKRLTLPLKTDMSAKSEMQTIPKKATKSLFQETAPDPVKKETKKRVRIGKKINKFLVKPKNSKIKPIIFNKKEEIKPFDKIKESLSKKEYLKKGKKLASSCISQYKNELNTLKQKATSSKLTFKDLLRSRYLFSTLVITIILLFLLAFSFVGDSTKYSTIQKDQTSQEVPGQKNDNFYLQESEVDVTSLGKMDTDLIDVAGLKNEVYFYGTNNSFYRYDANLNEFHGIPSSDKLSDIVTVLPMPDLNLIFFISNSSVYSFSPVLEKFDEHIINMPANADIIGGGIYLTFLYLLDNNSGQISRYPRAEGGFGSPIAWFSSKITTDNITSIAIDDSIRVTYSDGSIERYFKRKLTNSFLIDAEQKIVTKKIRTNNDIDFYYILDSENPRVVKINKNSNSIEKQYWNRAFENAKNFWIHNESEIYVVTHDNEILQFDL